MREVRVKVELSRTPKRVWLKILPNDAAVQILNISSIDAVRFRNACVEKLSEVYDVVISEPIPRRGAIPRLELVPDSKGELKPYEAETRNHPRR